MNVSDPCPRCGNDNNHWLSTTNEWEYYCPKCDLRFNEKGQIRPADRQGCEHKKGE